MSCSYDGLNVHGWFLFFWRWPSTELTYSGFDQVKEKE